MRRGYTVHVSEEARRDWEAGRKLKGQKAKKDCPSCNIKRDIATANDAAATGCEPTKEGGK